MTGISAAERARAANLRARFEAAGAQVVEPPILLPAETLLDLYGEDIRARAYVTSDALRGEQMLRPDFTVPVVEMHMAEGAEPARYTYAGEVFRRQEDHADRANAYLQVGYEVFDGQDPAAADADVFTHMAEALKALPVRAITGDIGILMSAVAGLRVSDARRAALQRHIWRPARFRALLKRFAGQTPVSKERAAVLAGDVSVPGTVNGRRSRAEILSRIVELQADADEPALPVDVLDAFAALMDVRASLAHAPAQLSALTGVFPSLEAAIERLQARVEALAARGVDVAAVAFDAGYGLTSMEYYDGFVFGLHADAHDDWPPVATGGRYDTLTARLGAALGNGASVPAVGGVLRPGLMVALEAAP